MTAEGLAGQRALVTGAGSGIGRAIAAELAATGAELVLTDQHPEGLAQVAEELGALAITCDLLDTADIPRLVAQATVSGGLDILVNCAGTAPIGPIETTDLKTWTMTLGVNLTAPFLLAQSALDHLRRSEHASILNVASGVGLRPDSGRVSAYASSKGGLIALTRSLAAELAPRIRVNAIAPGLTRTPMTEAMFESDETTSRPVLRYALQRAAEPREIAAAARFLVSPEASFITGVTLAVDGGRTFH